MNLNNEESQYSDVVKTLKGLQKVSAPSNFEADLIRSINSGKFEKKERSFWATFLLPSRLIPSAGIAVAAIAVLFLVNTGNPGIEENPLLFPPRVREDVVASKEVPPPQKTKVEEVNPEAKNKINKESVPPPNVSKNNSAYALNEPTSQDSDNSTLGITITGPNAFTTPSNQSMVSFSNGYPINRNGLNYMQRPLTREERAQLELLKKKLIEMMKELNK
ncbi:MAG TPA: hypothetical protein VKA26_12490 [Ignavibacteriaceae bacterium]|nr:hypothetical protein [Ignavibacteriaceae bacterium]